LCEARPVFRQDHNSNYKNQTVNAGKPFSILQKTDTHKVYANFSLIPRLHDTTGGQTG